MTDFPEKALPCITSRTALFLDFDGTLGELAATPDAVRLQPDVLTALTALQHLLDGALAVVSGRELADLDAFLYPLCVATAAEHGSVRRSAAGQLASAVPTDLGDALQTAKALAAKHPALLVEVKTRAVSLHYRQAPELEQICVAAMQAAAQRSSDLEVLRGKLVVELKPQGISKGTAISDFMCKAPFEGRQGIFAGDDVTDESGFAAIEFADRIRD